MICICDYLKWLNVKDIFHFIEVDQVVKEGEPCDLGDAMTVHHHNCSGHHCDDGLYCSDGCEEGQLCNRMAKFCGTCKKIGKNEGV